MDWWSEDSERLIPEVEEHFSRSPRQGYWRQRAFGQRVAHPARRARGLESELQYELLRSGHEYVRWLQRALNRLTASGLSEDGQLGPRTRAALIALQKRAGLTPDGIPGPGTDAALVRAGSGNPPAAGSGVESSTVPTSTSGASAADIVDAGGIAVHRSIAPQVRRLLAAAAADGVRLGGGGYRSPQKQVELRRKNCGTSDYAIWKMRPSQCTPPTAIPGRSNHERGLAIDFTYDGGGIKSHDNPGYRWLAVHAAEYGLKNLPSEPWHWSVDGR